MTIKMLFRYTTLMLRTALLLGALAFVNVQRTEAQPVSITADMPDAFETKTPVIGDGQYYYIQFYEELVYSPYLCCPFLGEAGNDGDNINAMDYMPFAPNRLWTLEEAGNGRFKLKSKRGNYIYLDGSNFKKTSSSTTASAFELIPKTNLRDGLTYYQLRVRDSVNLSREKGNSSNYEWATIISNPNNNAHNYVRFAQLKPNAAHIIYYRQEHNDGYDNSQYHANDPTTRHYLTYSNTGNESPARDGDFYESAVSSRRSVVPSNKSLWTLPTAAAYHQDGLWALEDAGSEGEFYIKKYEGEEYVNYQPVNTTGYGLSVLGTKDSEFGRYKLERPINNRYTRIENVNKFDNSALADSMFYNWSGSSAAATRGTAASIDWHVGENVANGSTIAGAATVNYNVYADLTGSTKLVFNGTAGMVLRLIFNRLEVGKVYSNSLYTGNSDSHGGSYIQRFCTIGSDGIGELDVSDLPYVHLNAIKNWSIAGTLSSITLVKPETVLVAANQFYDWDGYGADATPTQQETSSEFHLLMGSQLSQGDVVAGTGIVSYLAYADYTGYTKMILEGTPGTALRVLLNRPISPLQPGQTGYDENGGTAVEKTATIGADGKAVVDLSDLSFVHLNAVKIGWGSSGAVTAIKVQKPSTSGNTIYMTHSKGDGWPAMQRNDDTGNHWYAAFYPVEVPVPNKDDFFQVRLGLRNNESKYNINLNHGRKDSVTYSLLPGSTKENIIGATFTANDAWQNVFQYKEADKLSVGNHQKLVVRFGSPVEGNWGISGIVYKDGAWKQDWVEIPQGSTIYEMNLNGFTDIEDLTVFSTGSVDSNHNRITIAECYFLDGQMINYNGGASTISDANPDVWQLEQIDDYAHFRVKNKATGRYLKPEGEGVTEPNDPTGADIFTNQKLFGGFATPKWFFISPAVKEIQINGYVRHKVSYLSTYADRSVITDQDGLRKQGLSRDVDSDWMERENKITGAPYLLDGFIQKTNYFEITHYLKKGDSKVIEFPTVLNRNNDHIFFQRFYNFNEDDTQMDLANLKAHVSLDTRDDGDVQYFLYKNGMVTGQKLKWKYNDDSDIPNGGMARNEQRRFNFTNSDGKTFNVGIDVARYSDLEYKDETINNVDYNNLYEPSLTMRYLFYMNDAKEMAKKLTACPEGSGKWLEQKEFHFGRTQVPYTKFKKVGYRGEFIPVRHVFSDYWVYDDPQLINEGYLATLGLTGDALNDYLDQHLVSAVNDNSSGKIEVEIYDPNNTGIRRGGYNAVLEKGLKIYDNDHNVINSLSGLNNEEYDDSNDDESNYQGFYFYDKLSPSPKTEYGNSRFIVFRYPGTGIVEACDKPAYVRVYLNNDGKRYQLAQFTVIFDANMATRPWTEIKNGTVYANGVNKVKNTSRDPRQLRATAGHPIAKVTFDFPQKMIISNDSVNATYHYPSEYDSNSTDGITKHNGGNNNPGGTIANSSPVPLTFDHTNYAFDGDNCNWGSYALVTEKRTAWGNNMTVLPADDATYGYNIDADPGMQKAFMYIDASEQPGDICAVDFEGEFCPDDSLMCTGWISGSNRIRGDTRCPGSITLTVKGEDEKGNTQTIYRFCPGQIYELNNGYGADENGNATAAENAAGIDGNGNGATHVVWQQFFFKFTTDQKYERYWLEVNNNCVSSNGGDFMIDNVEVYAIVPEVIPDINTPLCVSVNEDGTTVTDMRLLKLKINYNKLKASRPRETSGVNEGTAEEGFVFLEKKKFLEKFKTELISWTATLTEAELHTLEINDMDFSAMSVDALADSIAKGRLHKVPTTEGSAYKKAFDNAILGSKSTWHSDSPETNMKASVLYFRWSTNTTDPNAPHYMHPYSFADAVNKKYAVFYEVDATDGEPYLVMNGNFPGLDWKTNTDYYVINTNATFTQGTLENPGNPCEAFNLCSTCCKFTEFRIEPPLEVLGLDASENTEELVVCEGQIPTLLTNLKGYDIHGNPVMMKNLNFDWWLGNKRASEDVDKLATLDNYHKQYRMFGSEKVYLAVALATMRAYYPDITSLDDITVHTAKTPHLTENMISYLRDVVEAGELLLHQTTISVPAEQVLDSDPYFYLVACPIHDEMFSQALNPSANEYIVFYCDEPQGVRIKLGEKAPKLQTGFVPGERGFNEYHYNFPANTNPVLSIRLAKAAQFETVKNDEAETVKATDPTTGKKTYNIKDAVNRLWLPIRNAETQGAPHVIKKAQDDNVYLASSNDLSWDKEISKEMNTNGSLPIVGRIVELKAIDTKNNSSANENEYNQMCIYFTKGFNVREGYNYTLSLPFQEDDDSNACDGTILINLKIVPDYEVWTGAAGNIDWNNDDNWRRADGNTTLSDGVNGDDLYRANGAATNPESPLHEYTTNKENYYSSSTKANAKPSSDQVLRKGFAPLYCTHVLMSRNEWGNAPELYDGLDYQADPLNPGYTPQNATLTDSPFPNLRDTSTPILKFDMQARKYSMWSETYGSNPDRGSVDRPNDLIAEMYQINSCDEIAFQPGTELRNAHLLNYNTAWMEYQLDNERWYLLGSPLQGTISGEWYAPTGSAKQQTTYYDPVTFGADYDRYSPAIYQRSWDKAKAVLYEIGADYDTADDSQTENLGAEWEGSWVNGTWKDPSGNASGTNADTYLDRLGYKPMDGNKANVAIKGIWSNTYNDAQVDYATGGFSVMVKNNLKNNDSSEGKSVIRLPKEDTMYDYYQFSEDGSDKGGTDTNLSAVQGKGRAKNRGRLKTDNLLPEPTSGMTSYTTPRKTETAASVYGDQRTYTRVPTTQGKLQEMNTAVFAFPESVPVGLSHLGYYLVENPFPCGLDMDKFFEGNPTLETKYWLLTATGQHLVQRAADTGVAEWITTNQEPVEYHDPEAPTTPLKFMPHAVVAPGQGFFVTLKTEALASAASSPLTVNFNRGMQAQSRFGVKDAKDSTIYKIVVGQSQVTKKMYDANDDGIPDTRIADDYEGDMYDSNNDGTPDKNVYIVPVYEQDGEGHDILTSPVLTDIEDSVVIFKYKQETLDATHKKEYRLQSRQTRSIDEEPKEIATQTGLVITARRGREQSHALVRLRNGASNEFLPTEDTETFICSEDLKNVPTVYTLCGRLATTINSIHDFRVLPVGVESDSDAPCTLTFTGVEQLGDSLSFYDAKEQKLTPLKSGMTFEVSGQTQNRYYIVRSLDKQEAADETHLLIFTEGLTAKVIASTAEPILSVRCYDTGGRLIHKANPQSQEYTFSLPMAGIYIIEAETENDHKTRKVLVK